MSPDEVIAALAAEGLNITRRTLLAYERRGLIDAPVFETGKCKIYKSLVVRQVLEAYFAVNEPIRFYKEKYLPLKEKVNTNEP